MSIPTAIYIDHNFIDPRYNNGPDDGDAFYTHGFGGLYSRQFKKYNPEWTVECWKTDPRSKDIQTKNIDGVKFIVFPSINIPRLGHLSKSLVKHFKKNTNPKAIYNISSFDHLLFYTITKYINKELLIVQHHGESPIKYKVSSRSGFSKIFWRLFSATEKRAFKKIDLLYVLDEKVKNWLPPMKPSSKIILRTTGVDENVFRPLDKREAKKELGLDPNKKHLLYIGKLNQTKRPDMLIDAYCELKKEISDIELLLAGCGKKDPFFQKAVNCGASVNGVIDQKKLYIYFSAADIYSLPLLDRSIPFGGIGMLSVQALLCETPIVGSTVESFPEKYRSEIGVVSQDLDSLQLGIRNILNNKRYSNLREKAIEFFSWASISAKTAYDYKLLLNEHHSAL